MKVIFVYGSTRPNSVSQKLLDKLAAQVQAQGHTVVKYDLGSMALEGCRGCGACRKGGCDCVREDGLKPYFAHLWTADAVVVSAPMYMGQAAGQNITFMNRHYCLKDKDKQNRLPAGKRVHVLFAQGAPADYPAYQAAQDWYMNSLVRYGFLPGTKLVVGGDSDLSENGPVLQKLLELSKTL